MTDNSHLGDTKLWDIYYLKQMNANSDTGIHCVTSSTETAKENIYWSDQKVSYHDRNENSNKILLSAILIPVPDSANIPGRGEHGIGLSDSWGKKTPS